MLAPLQMKLRIGRLTLANSQSVIVGCYVILFGAGEPKQASSAQ